MKKQSGWLRSFFSSYVGARGPSFLAGQQSRRVSAVLLTLILLGEAGLVLFVMRDLGRSYASVEKMYNGSVQGLLRFGELQYQAQETRRSTLYALTTNNGNLQVGYADQSRIADQGVTQAISEYLKQARTPREIEAGERLSKDWNAYLRVRDEVLGLILEGSPKEAVRLDLSLGVPEFDQVRQDLEAIKQNYNEQASQQLTTVAGLARRSVGKLTAALLFGLFLGTLAFWAIQRNRMRSAVQLAKLQVDFVASVSHELRTPLTAILLAGENVRDGFVIGPEGLFQQGSVITDQATQLMELIDKVLLFAATSEAEFPYPLGEVRPGEVIEHALRATQSAIHDAGCTVETNIDASAPPVIADLSVLSHCLQNLILNAAKYGSAGRWIGIWAQMDKEDNEVQISVQDRGSGIPAADLPRIFEPFYRSPQAVAANIHGTGLGLSIAKRSAEALGGELTVSSTVGVGSVFTIHLPVKAGETEEGLSSGAGAEMSDKERERSAHR